MRRLSLLLLALTILLTPFAGCGQSKKKGVIGLSVLTLTNPFFKVIADNLTDEMAKHGYEVITVSGDMDIDKQKKQVEDFLVRKVSAIVLCPCDSLGVGPVIKKANDAGVPVFTADLGSLAKEGRVECHVATDNYSGGKQAGEAMIEALGEAGGKIVILHYTKAESCLLRVKGFREVIDAHNGKRAGEKIEIMRELPGEGKPEEGHRQTLDALQAVPDLAGIFAINDPSGLGAYAALEQRNKAGKVKLIAFDGQPEGKQAIKEGKIYADPIQYPDKIGRVTAQQILRFFAGEKIEREILIPTSLYRKADGEKDASLK